MSDKQKTSECQRQYKERTTNYMIKFLPKARNYSFRVRHSCESLKDFRERVEIKNKKER